MMQVDRMEAFSILENSKLQHEAEIMALKQELRVATSVNRRAKLRADLLAKQDSLDAIQEAASRLGFAFQPKQPTWPWVWTPR